MHPAAAPCSTRLPQRTPCPVRVRVRARPFVLAKARTGRRTLQSMIRPQGSGATVRRALRRLAADPHVLLAIAVVLAALVVESASQARPMLVAVQSIAFLGIQIAAGLKWRVGRPVAVDT